MRTIIDVRLEAGLLRDLPAVLVHDHVLNDMTLMIDIPLGMSLWG